MFKFFLIAAICVVSVSAGYTTEQYENEFTAFIQKFEKTYSANELFSRFHTFKANMDAILDMTNDPEITHTVAMNEFGDFTHEEFVQTFNGYKNAPQRERNFAVPARTEPNDDSLDWVAKGAVTPVKNQGQCGSCWAFSTTGSTEGVDFLASGTLTSFSEQQLVDCSGSTGNEGCNGGLMDDAFTYIEQSGICTESDYPYKGVDGTCQSSSCQSAGHVSSYVDVTEGSEDDLMTAIQINPVSIAIDASGVGFQFYKSGVYSKKCGDQLDHGVLLVGYGTDNGEDYWKIKNSWGASWGEQGYIRFIRGQNQCGLANAASYPVA